MKVVILGGRSMLAYALRQVFSFETTLALSHSGCDITNASQMWITLSRLTPNVVINCAAYNDVDKAETNTTHAKTVNGYAVKWLAEVCRQLNCKMVHFSSEMVFGQEDYRGYTECAMPTDPVNVYGGTKLIGEEALKRTWDKHWLIRTSWLFGPGKENFVEKVLKRAEHAKAIEVVSDVFGCPTHTFDLARAVYSLVKTSAPYGTYHLVNEGVISKSGFAFEIIDHTTGNCLVEEVESKKMISIAKRSKYGVLLNTKRPQLRPWVEAMEEYLIGTGEMHKFR